LHCDVGVEVQPWKIISGRFVSGIEGDNLGGGGLFDNSDEVECARPLGRVVSATVRYDEDPIIRRYFAPKLLKQRFYLAGLVMCGDN
jgi:hypothetical protein